MTPQEEQLLVQIIVQCVRTVLETSRGDIQQPVPAKPDAGVAYQNSPASRFINVVPEQPGGKQNGTALYAANGSRGDVRRSLERFLRSSEAQEADGGAEKKPALQNGLVTADAVSAPEAQKRQLITQADILAAKQRGQGIIVLRPNAIITPLARQVAKEKGVELR